MENVNIEKKIEVGQLIYLKSLSRRQGDNKIITGVKVSKIGRKYFEVEPRGYGRFEINSMRQDGGNYSPAWKAYFDYQEIEDEREHNKLFQAIRKIFDWTTTREISLDQLRKIANILNVTPIDKGE